MLRRKWLELVLGASAGVSIARDWLVQSLEARELSPPQDEIPKTVAAAIKTHKASSIASFILTYPIAANAATVQEKGTMVYLLGVCPGSAGAWENYVAGTTQARYERAALSLVRSLQNRPTDLAEVARIAGGLDVAKKKLPQLLNSEFKTIVQTYVTR